MSNIIYHVIQEGQNCAYSPARSPLGGHSGVMCHNMSVCHERGVKNCLQRVHFHFQRNGAAILKIYRFVYRAKLCVSAVPAAVVRCPSVCLSHSCIVSKQLNTRYIIKLLFQKNKIYIY